MKRVFFGVTYLLLLSLMFAYMLINKGFNTELTANILTEGAKTGISVIGFIFIFPAFVFSVITICTAHNKIKFCRDMFTLFASVFCLASAFICAFIGTFRQELYIPIVLSIISLIAFVLSLINVIKGFKSENH